MKAPNFILSDQNKKLHKLSDYKGKWVLLYFYPKDSTAGCTIEACNFRDNLSKIEKKGVVLLGVSNDPAKSHFEFAQKHRINFPLLSDENRKIIKAYGAWGKKSFHGKEETGTLRNTYLIDPKGQIVKLFEKVTPLTHINEVLRSLEGIE